MITVPEIKNEAIQHFKKKEFDKALVLYKNLWENYREECNEWEGWRYAFCLKQLKDYKSALKICREVYPLNKNFENIKELYAWCIYYTEISIEKIHNEANLFRAGEGVIKLTKQQDKSIKKEQDFPCVYTLSISKILDFLKDKTIYNPESIVYWTNKLNSNLLETIPFKFTDSKGKEGELAPLKEKWYSLRSKALYENKQYKDCISFSETALNSFSEFHYDNNIWFMRNIALSKAGLGDLETAISELQVLLKKKNEWFIQKEIAELYKQQDKIDEAINFAVDAAMNFGDADKKMNLFKLLADLLDSQNKIKEAKAHIEFIFKIKHSNQWRIDPELLDLVKKHKIDTNKLPDTRELLNRLRIIWNTLKYGNQELYKGIIRTIISEGKAGFIDSDNKKSYFFSARSFKGKKELIQQGQRVSFFLEDSFDKKKNQPTKVATNIKPIK